MKEDDIHHCVAMPLNKLIDLNLFIIALVRNIHVTIKIILIT